MAEKAVALKTEHEVVIKTESGEIKITPSIIRKYLVNGDGSVSDQEIMMFMSLCKFQQLNPFLREAYLIKYGSQPATIVVGKETFLKRAMRIKECQGFKAGVICQCKESKEIIRTEGFCPPDCDVVGGWAEVHKEGWRFPLSLEVGFQEYVGRKKDGSITKMWTEKKATMIRKVALVQALREAFPESFGGMYAQEEMSAVDPDTMPQGAVDVNALEAEKQSSRRRAAKDTTLDVPPAKEAPVVVVEPQQYAAPPEGCKHAAKGEVSRADCEKEPCLEGCPSWTPEPGSEG